MRATRVKTYFVLFMTIVILFTNGPSVVAQSQSKYHPQCFFNFQFVLNIRWGNETAQPISPGETREVNLTISYTIARGAFGKRLLQLLEGGSFIIQLSIEDKPDWCTAWINPANITGIITPDPEVNERSQLFIHLDEDAPTNYTLGWVKIRGSIDDRKGPFNIITLIHGYENTFTVSFIPGP